MKWQSTLTISPPIHPRLYRRCVAPANLHKVAARGARYHQDVEIYALRHADVMGGNGRNPHFLAVARCKTGHNHIRFHFWR